MGLLDTGIKVLKDIKMATSNDPFVVGQIFEEYVDDLFSKKYFVIVEKTHSTETNKQEYIESSMNPDFVYRYKPTGELFAVECKYRSYLIDGKLSWSNTKQLRRYREFQRERNIPVFIVIGLGGEDVSVFDEMFCIPLDEAKYPDLYPSVFIRYGRDPEKPFFWKNGTLN